MLKIVIRADASIEIGTGHVMRCLTLADVLKNKGAEVSFICREHKGNLIHYIEAKGYFVSKLDNHFSNIEIPNKSDNSPLVHAGWLGSTQIEDAEACDSILETTMPDWLIVDHYAIDYRWQIKLKKHYKSLLVIDDLSDRKHECDLLLDQTFGRKEDEYNKLVPKDCILLLGAQYALLRQDFSKWREYSIKRRAQPQLKNLLITMGGVDPDNFTGRILDALKNCSLPKGIEITVVMGETAPHLNDVKKRAEVFPYKTNVKTNVSNMAEIMANADLAIGATGATTWERACLGLPSVQMVIADNQKDIAIRLDSIRAIKFSKLFNQLCESMNWLLHNMQKTSLNASSITDGQGVVRVVNYILLATQSDCSVLIEPAISSDSDFVYGLQTKEIREYSRNPNLPTSSEHTEWFDSIINSHESQLFIITINKQRVGVLRADDLCTKTVEISIIVSPNHAGKGIAKKALIKLEHILSGRMLKAVIHKKNIPSMRVFEKCGFNSFKQYSDFVEYFKNV